MRASVLLVLAALASAGCASSVMGGPGQVGVCLERGVQATWREPALGDGFAQAARRAGWAVSTEAPRDGFEAPLPDAATFVFVWMPEWPRARPSVSMADGAEPGMVAFTLSGHADRAEGERLFRDFLGHVGLADAPERDAWVSRLLAERDEGGVRMDPNFPQIEVAARPALSEPLAALRGAALVPTEVGGATMQAGEWQAHVRFPVHVVLVPLEEGAKLTVWTDGLGSFRAHTTVKDFDKGWHLFQNRTETAFADLGLPPPTWNDASGGGAPC